MLTNSIAKVRYAQVAQSVEHSLGKGEVAGSSPVLGTSYINIYSNKYTKPI